MPQISPHLWYTKDAEKAAAFYASILPHSSVDRIITSPSESPSGPAGSVTIVEFTLIGQPFTAISAGPLDLFNHAISLMVECDTQEEIDTYWTALSEGGAIEECGWLKDRYGLSWQIAPRELREWNADPDRSKAKRVFDVMLTQKKLDLAALKAAYEG